MQQDHRKKSLYLVASSALHRDAASGAPQVVQRPFLIYHYSVRDAARVVSQEAFEVWPISRGYTMHRVNVNPLRIDTYEQMAAAMNSGNCEVNNLEESQYFACSDFVDVQQQAEPIFIEWPEELG